MNGDQSTTEFPALQRLPLLDIYSLYSSHPSAAAETKKSNNKNILYDILAYNPMNGDQSTTAFPVLQRLPVLDIYSYTPVTQVLPQKQKIQSLKHSLR